MQIMSSVQRGARCTYALSDAKPRASAEVQQQHSLGAAAPLHYLPHLLIRFRKGKELVFARSRTGLTLVSFASGGLPCERKFGRLGRHFASPENLVRQADDSHVMAG